MTFPNNKRPSKGMSTVYGDTQFKILKKVVNPDPKVILITVDACFVFIIDKVADKLELFGLILSIILFFNIFFGCEFFSKRTII